MAERDGVAPSAIQWVGKTNPLDWPATQDLLGVEFRNADPQGGVRPILPGGDDSVRWPDIIPDGWDGPIRYAICLGRKIRGVWTMACALEFYTGKHWTGAPLHLQYNDWFSVGKGFGPLEGLGNVVPGEELLFMLVAGSLRLKDTSDQPGPDSVRERSNIIRVTFTVDGVALALPPEGGSGPVVVTPPPGPTPTPVPTDVEARLRRLEDDMKALLEANLVNRVGDLAEAQALIAAKADHAVGVAQAAYDRPVPTKTKPTSATIFGLKIPIPSVPLE